MIVSDPPRTTSVTVRDLCVRRGGRVVLEGLNLSAAAGELVLIRGPNGAGKSSLLLALCKALRAESGQIVFSGAAPEARAETEVHFVGHQTGVKPQLSVAENLSFWADLYGGERSAVAPALERLGLGGLGSLPAGYLSAGQTRRLALARLLVAERPVWLLDEPTAALDAAGAELIAALIGAHVLGGGVVLAATHDALDIGAPTRTIVLGEAAP